MSDFQLKMKNDPEFAQFVENMKNFQEEAGYTPPKSHFKEFMHNLQTTLAFIVMVIGAIYIYGLDDSQTQKIYLACFIVYIFCVYRLINKSYIRK